MRLTRTQMSFVVGTTVAATAANRSLGKFLFPNRFDVVALLDGQESFAAIPCILWAAGIDLRMVVTKSREMQKELSHILIPTHCSVETLDALTTRGDDEKLPLARIVLGRWNRSERQLLSIVSGGRQVYIDDPVLAKRLVLDVRMANSPKTSSVGFNSIFDPAIEHTKNQLSSGVMGRIARIDVSTRIGDLLGVLEASAALQQLDTIGRNFKIRHIVTRNSSSAIHIVCSRGQFTVPLYSKSERAQTLPLRLRLFEMLMNGEEPPVFSLPEMLPLPIWT